MIGKYRRLPSIKGRKSLRHQVLKVVATCYYEVYACQTPSATHWTKWFIKYPKFVKEHLSIIHDADGQDGCRYDDYPQD